MVMLRGQRRRALQLHLRRFRGDSLWLIGQSVYTIVLGLVITGIAARVYGPVTYGLLAVAIAVSAVATPLANLGMDSVVVHTLVRGGVKDAVILRTSVVLRLTASATLFGLIVLGVSFVDHPSYDPPVIAAMGLMLMLKTGEAYLPWFQARSHIPRSTIARIVAYTVTVSVRIVVLAMGWPIAVFALTYALDAALAWLALYLAKRSLRAESQGDPMFSPSLAKVLLGRSWPLILSGLAVSLYNRMDQIMLGFMLPDRADVGRYAAAVMLSEAWYFVPLAVVISRQPRVMRAHGISSQQFRKATQRLFDHAIGICLLLALGVAVGSPVLLGLLFGTEFVSVDSIVCAVLLSVSGVLAVAGSARAPWLIAQGLERYTLLYLCAGAGSNVLFNVLLIPPYGIVGAAVATLVAQCLSVVLVPALIPSTRPSVGQMMRTLDVRRWARRFGALRRTTRGEE